MKRLLPVLLLASATLPAGAEAEYAYVVQETRQGYTLHPQAAGVDFAAALADFDPLQDGEKTDGATWGAPRWLAARINGKTYLICVDNQHGILSLHRATRHANTWIRKRGTREIYHPALYDRLRAAGLNIHTHDELKAMSRHERRQALSGQDAPIRRTENKK